MLRNLSAPDIFADAGAIATKTIGVNRNGSFDLSLIPKNARRLGLTQGEISEAFYSHLTGTKIGVLREGNELRNIITRPFDEERIDAGALQQIQVVTPTSGRHIPIA